MRAWLQHRFNAISIYCRLRDLGLPKPTARRLAAGLGWLLHPLLYGRN